MKRCSKCKELKQIVNFGKDKRNKNGLRSQCKECEKIYNRHYEQRHKEERNEKRKLLGKQYRETHKEQERQRYLTWKENNPEKYKAYHTKTKLRHRCQVAEFDKDITLEKLYNRDGGKCAICGKPCDYSDYQLDNGVFIAGDTYPSIDHIIPLSRGGSHTWNNIQLTHKVCNSVKSNKL